MVSVNWNGKHHLAHLLPSLQGQKCREIIVVDNGSSDGSVEWLEKSFPQVRLIRNSANLGFAHPCNQGARAAQGSVVAFINNDMKALPGWIEEAVALLRPPVACVASRILDWEGRRIDFNGASMQYLGFALQRDLGRLAEEVSHEDRLLFPCGGAMLADRQRFLDLGGFDPDYFAIFEDVDLGWRLWVCGHEVAFAPNSQACHRGHATFQRHGDEKMRYLMHRNALMTVLKNYGDGIFERMLPIAVRLAIKRAIQLSGVRKESFYLWAQARYELRQGDAQAQERWIDAFNHLVALDDVLEALPALLEKRRSIQSQRKREDERILELFVDPMRTIVEDPEYLAEEGAWLQALKLNEVFAPGGGKGLGDLPERLNQRLRRLQGELKAAQWNAGHALQRQPAPERPGLGTVLRSLRRDGAAVTLRRIAERLRRAH